MGFVHNIRRVHMSEILPFVSESILSTIMLEFLGTPFAKAVESVAVLMILMAVGFYLVQRFRDRTDEDRQTASDLLTNFREMRHEGDISESEFRTIKTVLGHKLQEELTEEDPAGSSGN